MKKPKIIDSPKKRMIGMRLEMTTARDQTFELFSAFMPRKKEIKSVNSDVYSIQLYNENIAFEDFGPNTIYSKWAAVEVDESETLPAKMEEIIITAGKYAVFIHKGTVPDFFQKTNPFIYGQWLPKSGFSIADRPHFQVMGQKYRGNDPESEEEVWVPID